MVYLTDKQDTLVMDLKIDQLSYLNQEYLISNLLI